MSSMGRLAPKPETVEEWISPSRRNRPVTRGELLWMLDLYVNADKRRQGQRWYARLGRWLGRPFRRRVA